MIYTAAGAHISACGKYRYLLWRRWGTLQRRVLFVMLNPSTADGSNDDPTIIRCVNFADLWGFDGCDIVNMYAYRAINPKELGSVIDPIGPANEFFVRYSAENADRIIVAWGNHGSKRQSTTLQWLSPRELFALRISRDGYPGHPLYLPSQSKIIPFAY